jgi:flagellar biosynthetic protein FliR
MVTVFMAFGEQAIPVQIRLAIALAFTFVVAPALPAFPVPQSTGHFMGYIATETLAGVSLGVAVRFMAHALQTAGSIAAQSTSLAQMLGGAGVDPMPAVGAVLFWAGMALAMMLGLHVRAAEFMIYSYQLLPAGQFPDAGMLSEWGVGRVSKAFALGFTLSAPFVITAVIYNLTLGIINRAMPQLMVAMVGAPVITFGGLVILMVGAPMILNTWSEALNGFFADPGGALR